MQKSAQLPEMSLTITFEELVSKLFQQEGERRYHGGIDVILEEPCLPPTPAKLARGTGRVGSHG